MSASKLKLTGLPLEHTPTTLTEFLSSGGWETVHTEVLPERSAERVWVSDLPLCPATVHFLATDVIGGIYRHQHEALYEICNDKNVCLTTGIASGKSLVFYAASIELFSMHRQTIAVQSTPIHEHTVHQAAGAVDVVGDFRKF